MKVHLAENLVFNSDLINMHFIIKSTIEKLKCAVKFCSHVDRKQHSLKFLILGIQRIDVGSSKWRLIQIKQSVFNITITSCGLSMCKADSDTKHHQEQLIKCHCLAHFTLSKTILAEMENVSVHHYFVAIVFSLLYNYSSKIGYTDLVSLQRQAPLCLCVIEVYP